MICVIAASLRRREKRTDRRHGMKSDCSDITVIIPSYKPDGKLINTLSGILAAGFDDIIVVDDGGGDEYARFFSQAEKLGCTVLHHDVNRGKGAALKTAFSFFAENRMDRVGAVTADADGQHLPGDIASVAAEMKETGKVILGSRDFSDPQVPSRSRFGNRCSSLIFRLFIGMKISDTQTGLRAIPGQYIHDVMEVQGDRYEYETRMLFLIKKKNIPYLEKTISTVYIDDNSSSHFRPVIDSLRIYSMILAFAFSSMFSALADNLFYYICLRLIGSPSTAPSDHIASIVIARVLSSLINYTLNAKTVFGGRTDRRTLSRYFILAIAQITVSAALVWHIKTALRITSPELQTMAKMLVDTVLFFFSFRIQHSWVFKESANKSPHTS